MTEAHMRGQEAAAVIFDRDGTLVVDDGYMADPAQLRWQPGAIEAIKTCNAAGTLAIIATNQSGMGRGYFSRAQMDAFHDAMRAALAAEGAHIDALYACPFHPDAKPPYQVTGHPEQKPNPGMVRRALFEHPIDPTRTLVIGDGARDVEAGRGASVQAIQVQPGQIADVVRAFLGSAAAPSLRPVGDLAARLLKPRAAKARGWLFGEALPMWSAQGFDRATGLFEERLGLDGAPVPLERRVRVQARQTFVFALAGELGWSGPWRDLAAAGVRTLRMRALRPDGGTRHRLGRDGMPVDERRDLYDLAFVTFAFATAGRVLGDQEALADAARLIDWLEAAWSAPHGGFREGDVTPQPPRRQNPHMHLLEALLALHEATGDARWLAKAAELGELAAARFIDPEHAALREYFAEDWSPAPGEEGDICEPGHQFEWSWLLHRLHVQGGPDRSALADRLAAHGEVYGVDPGTGRVFDETTIMGAVRARSSRCWPYTERIKSAVTRFERRGRSVDAMAAAQAFDVLMTYCDTPLQGLWRDRWQADGSFVEEPAPASSFYHIGLALAELIRVADAL